MSEEDSQIDFIGPDGEIVYVRARSEDPATSHLAAAILTSQQERIGKSIRVVLEILRAYGVQSDFAIRAHWSEFSDEEKFSEGLPRMARLWAQRKRLIVQAGETIHNGRRCRTWRLTE